MQEHSGKKVLVLGGGYAGVVAALRLRRKSRGAGVAITLVDDSDHFVERIRLHQQAADQTVARRPYPALLAGADVRFLQGRISRLAPDRQQVHVQTADGPLQVGYDFAIYALGSIVDTTIVPGAAEHALSLSSEATTRALQEALPGVAARQGQLVVCGGGLTGIEAASELAERYPRLKITLVTADRFGEQLAPPAQSYLRQAFRRRGIEVVDGERVAAVCADHLEAESGRAFPFDICLWAASFRAPDLARRAGLRVNHRDQVIVDEHLRVPAWPNIYAVGDAASLEEALAMRIRMGCVTAAPMGSHAADHLGALLRGEPAPEAYSYRYLMRCISLGRQDGIVQFVEADDTPKRRILTGRLAAVVKELISRSSVWNLQIERLLTLAGRGGRTPRTTPAPTVVQRGGSLS